MQHLQSTVVGDRDSSTRTYIHPRQVTGGRSALDVRAKRTPYGELIWRRIPSDSSRIRLHGVTSVFELEQIRGRCGSQTVRERHERASAWSQGDRCGRYECWDELPAERQFVPSARRRAREQRFSYLAAENPKAVKVWYISAAA